MQFNKSAPCFPISYRKGNCCNQTLEGVSMALTDSAKASAQASAGCEV